MPDVALADVSLGSAAAEFAHSVVQNHWPSEDTRPVVLKVTVEVSVDKSDTILIREGDDPEQLAAELCERHRLQPALVAPLAQHIRENLVQAVGVEAASEVIAGSSSLATARAPYSEPITSPQVLTPRSGGPPSAAPSAVASSSAAGLAAAVEQQLQHLWEQQQHYHQLQLQRQQQRPVEPIAQEHYPQWQAPPPPVVQRQPQPGFSRPSGGSSASGRQFTPPPRTQRVTPRAQSSSLRAQSQPAAAHPRTPRREGSTSSPRQPPISVAETGSTSARRATTPRFERLHQDAEQRKNRLERLRQEAEKDLEEQQHLGSEVRIASASAKAWQRYTIVEDSGLPCDRLYREATKRKKRMEQMQQQRQAEKQLHEQQDATFRPSIAASQRSWAGIGRAMRDPEGRTTRCKLERMREERDEAALDGCTFQPQIDQRSEEIMHQRLSRMQVTGNLYDALYEDALRRKARQADWERSLPPGVTFQPDLGEKPSAAKQAVDESTQAAAVHRLAYSKAYSDKVAALRKQLEEEQREMSLQDARSQPEFHPQVGRGPLVERNREGLPIGEFLYEAGRERALQNAKTEEERSRSQPSTPRVGETSRALFEETKMRKYRGIFESLCRQDSRGVLRAATLQTDGLEEELVDLLSPVFSYLFEEEEAELDFEAFSVAVDYQRRHAAAPTAHLFVQKSSTRTSTQYRQQCEDERFEPHTDKRSSRLAARVRPRSVPVHEQLHRDREAREQRLAEQRVLLEERELQECTFQPNSQAGGSRPSSAGSGCHRRGSTGGLGAPGPAVMMVRHADVQRRGGPGRPRSASSGRVNDDRGQQPQQQRHHGGLSGGSKPVQKQRPASGLASGRPRYTYQPPHVRDSGPPAVLLGQVSLGSDHFSGGSVGAPSSGDPSTPYGQFGCPDNLSAGAYGAPSSGGLGTPCGHFGDAEPSFGYFCRGEMQEVQQAAADYNPAVGMAKEPVTAVHAI